MPEMEGAGKAVTVYKNKVAQLQLQIAEMKTLYTGDYEPLRQSKAELDSNINLLRDEIQRYLKSRKIQAASLQSSIEENERNIGRLEELIKDTAQRRANYEAIKQDHKLAVDAYSDAKGKLEQARQAASLNQEKQNISQIDPPELPHQPFKPNRILLVVLGLLASIFVGVASALVADYFDHTLKTPEDIERYLDSPFLGSLPRVGL